MNFDDYCFFKRRKKIIIEVLSKLPIHMNLRELTLKDLLMDYDATSLYPSAMLDDNSTYPKRGTGYAFLPDMNDETVQKLNNQTFAQGSAILKLIYYNPPDLITQHLPVKEKVKQHDFNRLRNSFLVESFKSVDMQEIVEIGGRNVQIYEGVIYREDFKVSPFRKVIEKLFNLGLKHKNECNGVMQGLVKLIMNSLYGENVRRGNNVEYKLDSEYWMNSEIDENVLGYWRLQKGELVVKLKQDDGLESYTDLKKTLCQLILVVLF